MVKSKSSQVAVQERPLHQIAALDLERVPPSALVSEMAFTVQGLAANIDNLADVSLEMTMTAEGASLKFRAYSRRPGLT
jgi:hypothetical protein